MPARAADLVSAGGSGSIRLRRRFGSPTCLDPHERVFLVIEDCSGLADVTLNGEVLGEIPPGPAWEFDITDQLKERNELVLHIDLPARQSDDLIFRQVRLEIRG